MPRIDHARSRIDAWMFAPGSARRLAAVRIGLCALLALRLARGIYVDVAGQPASLYRPLSFMKVFGSITLMWPLTCAGAYNLSFVGL